MTNLGNAFSTKSWKRIRGYWQHVWAGAGPWFGVDYAMPTGTKVLSVRSGAVNYVGWERRGFGNYIIVQHRNSLGKLINLYTVYAHLSKVYVKPRQVVKARQVIGLSGSTGWSTGPHLHFTILTKVLGVFRPRDPENRKAYNWAGTMPPNYPYR